MNKRKHNSLNHHVPLIERILIIGLKSGDLEHYFKDKANKLENIKLLKLRILEEYKSSELTTDDDDPNLYENIPKFCLPEGILVNSFHENSSHQITSFTLLSKEKKKYITALQFNENYTENKRDFSIQKVITLISSKDIFGTHKRILENIYSIIINYYINKSTNLEQIRTIYYLSKTEQFFFQEYRLLDFYFSFILNSLTIKSIYSDVKLQSFCLYNIPNNKNKKYFLQYSTHDSTPFPLKDYDMSLLLDKFHMEDLIILYQSLLMEYKIVIIFDNYEDINIILYSLANIIYPLKWNFLIISYLLNETEMMLDSPFAIMIGAHRKYLPMIYNCIKRNEFSPETIVYDLNYKSFIFMNSNFPEFPAKMNNELRSGLYFLLSEKLLMKSDVSIDTKSEMSKILRNESLCSKVNPLVYFNLRIISIFYLNFLELIKKFKSYIKYNKTKETKAKLRTIQVSEYFAFNDYINDFKKNYSINISKYMIFIKNFSKSLMFNNFILKFVLNSSTKPKYKFVNEHLDIIEASNERYRSILKNKLVDVMHDKYVDLSDAFYSYIKKIKISNVAPLCSIKEHNIWTPLDNNKISSFNVFFETFPNKPKENDDLPMIYNVLESCHIVTIEEINPIMNDFDWTAVKNLKHKKTSSSINKSIKFSTGNNKETHVIEEEISELTSSSSAKMNLIGNKKKISSLKKIKGNKIGQYDFPLQINNLPKPFKKVQVQNSKFDRMLPNPNTNSNCDVPKHKGDDECDLFSDNEQ